jgi:1,4-dihydroxy-2-naphthoyl-CoA synthase
MRTPPTRPAISKSGTRDIRAFQTIKAEVQGALGRLTLNRPERLNAISATTLQELVEAARWFDSHRELRVVILSGAGRAFSAGADLHDSPEAAAAPPVRHSWISRREAAQYGLRATDALEQMRAVTIAQIHGYAVGGGVVLISACDLRIAADDASLLYSGDRSRHPAHLGRDSAPGPGNRPGADQGTRDDVPAFRTRRGQGDRISKSRRASRGP